MHWQQDQQLQSSFNFRLSKQKVQFHYKFDNQARYGSSHDHYQNEQNSSKAAQGQDQEACQKNQPEYQQNTMVLQQKMIAVILLKPQSRMVFGECLRNGILRVKQKRDLSFYYNIAYSIVVMLDFQTQKKLLQPILKNPKNYLCADCDAISPTWASLDFGVFLCSNCSGAHRALGPTITRVRSANLDKWQQDWLSNMKIGNSELNTFWESSPDAVNRKPKADADLNDIKRYVYQKYVKRKFVSSHNACDPLTLYKSGQYQISNPNHQNPFQTNPLNSVKPIVPPKAKIQSKRVESTAPKVTVDLLDFSIGHSASQGKQAEKPAKVQDEFTEFTQFSVAGSQQKQKANETDLISFDTLISSHKQTQPQAQQNQYIHNSYQSLKAQNMQLHHPYNPQLAQHNLVYQNHYQQQNYLSKGGYAHTYNGQPIYGMQGHTPLNQSPGFWF